MVRLRHTYCLYTLLLLLLPVMVTAQTSLNVDDRKDAKDLLGSGGSNFSTKRSKDLIDNNGLRTGQYTGEHHLVGAYFESGYSAFVSPCRHTFITPGGYSVGGGFAYEYQLNAFLLQIGLGITLQDVKTSVADTTFTKYHTADAWTNSMYHRYGDWNNRLDTFYYDLQYDFYDRQDRSRMVYAQIPVLLGQQIVGRRGVGYYLAGVKLGYALQGKTSVKATGTTTGHYDRYIGTFHEMDNHGFRKDVPIEREGKRLDIKFDLMAHAEVGYEYGIYSPTKGWRGASARRPFDLRLRVAAYCDFSILSINPKTDFPMVVAPDESRWDFPTFRLSHVYSTNEIASLPLRNMFVGVKLTALFGVKQKEKCVLCGFYKTERDF